MEIKSIMDKNLTVGIIVIGAIVLNVLIRKIIDKKSEKPGRVRTMTGSMKRRIKGGISFIIFILTLALVLTFIPALRQAGKTLFTGAGVIGIIIGFSAQEALSNIIGGLFIAIWKPFRIGDIVTLEGDQFGTIEDLTLRHTIIVNLENQRIIIPNSKMNSENIVNHSIEDLKICKMINIGISYDSDIDKALELMQDECVNHPLCIDNRTDDEKEKEVSQITVRVLGFGDSSINLRAYAWTTNPIKGFQMASDLNRAIKYRFDKEGIEIPFPYRTIVYKKDLPSNN